MALTRRKQKASLKKDDRLRSVGVRTGIGAGQRTIKMIEPHCPSYELNDAGVLVPASDNCQVVYNHPLWWKLCDHVEDKTDLYRRKTERIDTLPVIEEKNGRRVIVAHEQVITETAEWNWTQVPFGSERVNSGRSIGDAQLGGAKHPSELGLRDCCEYRNCFNQPDSLLVTPYGTFCKADEARLVGADVEEVVLEVWDRKKRRAQLRQIELDLTDGTDGE